MTSVVMVVVVVVMVMMVVAAVMAMMVIMVVVMVVRCLTTSAAAELPIDTARVVQIRTNHVQTARLEDSLLLGLEIRLVLLFNDLVRLSEVVLQLRAEVHTSSYS